MINYKEYNKSVFRSCASNQEIVSSINSISIQAWGTAVENPIESSIPSAILHAVSMQNDCVSFVVSIDIPVLGAHIVEEVIGEKYTYTSNNSDATVEVTIDHDINYQQGLYDIDADILIKNFIITPNRKLDVFGYSTINIADGYNTKISYINGVLQILGGAGLGKGKDLRRLQDNSPVPGIRSINGISDSRNIDISVSDKLITYGARVR